MDFSKEEPEALTGKEDENKQMDYVKGGSLVSRDWNKPLLETMNGVEISAAITEADLRKRLRVDRARKLN